MKIHVQEGHLRPRGLAQAKACRREGARLLGHGTAEGRGRGTGEAGFTLCEGPGDRDNVGRQQLGGQEARVCGSLLIPWETRDKLLILFGKGFCFLMSKWSLVGAGVVAQW